MLLAVIALDAAAVAVLTGLGGSAAGQIVRLAVAVTLTGLALWYASRAERAGRGAVALSFGIAGSVSGAGVAVAHLSKEGPDTAAVLAVIALGAGLFLLIWGAAALVRAVPGWWRLLAIPAAWGLLEFVLLPLTMAVYATNVPPGPSGQATPARYGLAYREVGFRTADGVRLSGWYVPSRNGAAVLLLPGSGSARTAVLPQAAVLARHGYGALLLDTRGHGLSGGHAMDFGWWGGRDIAAAMEFLNHQSGVHSGKLAVVGESMGGEQALAAMGGQPLIRAVVAEGATGQQPADHGWKPDGIGGAVERGMEWVEYSAAGLISGAPRPPAIPDSLRAGAPRPALLIAGGSAAAEPAAARWFKAASPATVRVWVVPSAGHTQGLAADPRGWETRVIAFLDAALRPAAR